MLNDDSSYFAFRGAGSPGEHKTSTTFLVRLQDQDPAAWREFTEIYAPLIKYWCRQRKDALTHAERQDILQEVLQSVSLSIKKFDHTREERSFRGWLRRITKCRIGDFFREKAKDGQITRLAGDSDYWDIPLDEIDPEEETGERRVVLRQVLKRIRPEFQEKTWEVFQLLFVAEKASAEVAEMMGMTGMAVRQVRSRILRRIQAEYARLGIEMAPASAACVE